MSKTFRPWLIDQPQLLAPSVMEFLPSGHVAHFVRNLVREDLDLGAILGAYVEERGYPPHHPATMTALLLYGYSRGAYSSRRLARACEERLDFLAVTAMSRPDHRTICEFRRRHLAALLAAIIRRLAGFTALRFYQRHGFRLAEIRFGAVDAARRLKPSIPLLGDHGIPIHDEIELMLDLGRASPPAMSQFSK